MADTAHLTRQRVNQIERRAELPEQVEPDELVLLANAFGMKDEELLSWYAQQPNPAPTQQKPEPFEGTGIPLLAEVPAGEGDPDPTMFGLDNGLGVAYISRNFLPHITDPTAYALVVKGDSMADKYPDGIVVVCSPRAKHVPGKVYAIRFGSELDNECTLKRVTPLEGGKLLLMADNPKHEPQTRIVDREHVVRMDLVVARIGGAD